MMLGRVVTAGSRLLAQTTGYKMALRIASLHLTPCSEKLSEFQMKKLTNDFDHLYDRNGDGFVDSYDVEYFKRRLRGYLGQTKTPSQQDSYILGYTEYWLRLKQVADTNKDGKLSREEWVELWEKIIEEAENRSFNSLPDWVKLLPKSIFPLMDTNGDGVLDPEEYRTFWYHVGSYPMISDIQLKECWDDLTENGKRPLDEKRLEELYADFYLSNDPSSPGKYVAGPIQY